MRKTIFSSLFLLVPAYRAAFVFHHSGDWLMFTLAMFISAVNHAHINHPETDRRMLFRRMDDASMSTMAVVVGWQAFWTFGYPAWASMAAAALGVYAVYWRRTWGKPLEFYSEAEDMAHVACHLLAIVAITAARTPFVDLKKIGCLE
jgi:hypothetical protein